MALPSLKSLFSQVSNLFQPESTDKSVSLQKTAKTSWWQSFFQGSSKLNAKQANQLWSGVASNVTGKTPAQAAQERDNAAKVPKKYEVTDHYAVSVVVKKGETAARHQWRGLYAAAQKAGLPEAEAKSYATKNVSGNLVDQQTKTRINDAGLAQMQGLTDTLHLSQYQIYALRQAQAEFLTNGGKLGGERSATGNVSKNLPPEAKGRIDGVGTISQYGQPAPDKLTKSVTLPNDGKEVTADRVLRRYITEKYGQGNLWTDNLENIWQAAKQNGVSIANLKAEAHGATQTVKFDITPADLWKLQNAVQNEQTIHNAELEKYQESKSKTVSESFLRGFFKGAREDLWANANAVYEVGKFAVKTQVDPLGAAQDVGQTIWKVGEAVAQDAAIHGASDRCGKCGGAEDRADVADRDKRVCRRTDQARLRGLGKLGRRGVI